MTIATVTRVTRWSGSEMLKSVTRSPGSNLPLKQWREPESVRQWIPCTPSFTLGLGRADPDSAAGPLPSVLGGDAYDPVASVGPVEADAGLVVTQHPLAPEDLVVYDALPVGLSLLVDHTSPLHLQVDPHDPLLGDDSRRGDCGEEQDDASSDEHDQAESHPSQHQPRTYRRTQVNASYRPPFRQTSAHAGGCSESRRAVANPAARRLVDLLGCEQHGCPRRHAA